jgi:hypothetical protein
MSESNAYACLGRNEEFLQNAADYAQAVVISAEVLRIFPDWIKPYASLPFRVLGLTMLTPASESWCSSFRS